MKTDKQVYKILAVCPQWFFDLTQIESPGRCSFRSVALKDVEVTADGVIEPEMPDQPCFVFEFQAQPDDSVYPRIVMEMVLLQRQYPGRKIEGAILFLDASLDSQAMPWSRIVQSFSLTEQLAELQQARPGHPLLAVFTPLAIADEKRLESEAATC